MGWSDLGREIEAEEREVEQYKPISPVELLKKRVRYLQDKTERMESEMKSYNTRITELEKAIKGGGK